MMKKKLLYGMLSLSVVLAMCGCGKGKPSPDDTGKKLSISSAERVWKFLLKVLEMKDV